MQADPVAFDLRTMIDGPSVWGRILIFYLLGLGIAVFVVAVRVWRQLGFLSNKTIERLQAARRKMQVGDKASLVALGAAFFEHSPERGLRAWSGLSGSDAQETFKNVARQADATFRFYTEDIAIMLGSLRMAGVFGLLLTAFVFIVDARNRLWDLPTHVMASGLLGVFIDVLPLVAHGVLTALLVYAVYWHFSSRLACRRNHWQDFVSRALDE